jgi:hypothetical protein
VPILVAFLAYCLDVTLRAKSESLTPGLTPRAIPDKFAVSGCLTSLPASGRTPDPEPYTDGTPARSFW